jgi:hypothetical protein
MINSFSSYPWEKVCCIADYYHGLWDKPKYPQRFWLWFTTIRSQFNNEPNLSDELKTSIEQHITLIQKQRQFISKRFTRLQRRYESRNIFCVRVKLSYYKWADVRWTHTSAGIYKAWHPMISFFCKTPLDYAAVINNHWNHIYVIQKLRAKINYAQVTYKHFENPFFKAKNVGINTMLEHNLQTNFASMKTLKVGIFAFDKKIKTNTNNQAQDDIIFDTNTADRAHIQDTRVHALDQKATPLASMIPEPSSKMFSAMSAEEYYKTLQIHKQNYLNNVDLTQEHLQKIEQALDLLFTTCEDIKAHQLVWLQNIHLFHDNYIPPMRLPHNFCIEDLPEELLLRYNLTVTKFDRISDLLYYRGVPCDYEAAATILDESFIQKIFEEVDY